MRHKALRLSSAVSGAIGGAVLVRHWLEGRRGRVDVYFDDGSFVTFCEGSPEADRLVPLARQVLAAAEAP
jgi:hypothetical protein